MEGRRPTRCSRSTTPDTARCSPGSAPASCSTSAAASATRPRASPARTAWSSASTTTPRPRVAAASGRPRRAARTLRFAAMDGAALGLRDRRRSTAVVLVAHHRALHEARAPRRRARPGLRRRRHRVRHHAEPPGRLREPVPRLPVRARRARVAAARCSSTTSRCSASRATTRSRRTSGTAATRGDKLLRLDVFDLRHRMPRSWYVWSYERVLPVVYQVLGSEENGIGSGLDDVALLHDTGHHADHARAVRDRPLAPPVPRALTVTAPVTPAGRTGTRVPTGRSTYALLGDRRGRARRAGARHHPRRSARPAARRRERLPPARRTTSPTGAATSARSTS